MTRYRFTSIAMAGATAVVLAGCSSTSGAPSTQAADPKDATAAYERCLRDHGIEEVDNGSGAIEITSTTDGESLTEALDACTELADAAFGEFELDPEQEAEARDRDLAFARCMRANGAEDFPDPEPGSTTGARTIDGGGATDPDVLDAAFETCGTEVYGGGVNTEHFTTRAGEQ